MSVKSNNKIKVIGVDPSPAKATVIYDGDIFLIKNSEELSDWINEIKQSKGNILLSWDSPLTGPNDIVNSRITNRFAQRPIEAFFSREKNYSKLPKGISVRPYSGCSHWVISQYLLGLPLVGHHFNNKPLPFLLVTTSKTLRKKSVIEVHPAIAIWLWCKEGNENINWEYKKPNQDFKTILKILKDKQIISKQIEMKINDQELYNQARKKVKPDDVLDAYIAWYLGDQFANHPRKNLVELFGDNATGAWLVPKIDQLKDKFDDFIENYYPNI